MITPLSISHLILLNSLFPLSTTLHRTLLTPPPPLYSPTRCNKVKAQLLRLMSRVGEREDDYLPILYSHCRVKPRELSHASLSVRSYFLRSWNKYFDFGPVNVKWDIFNESAKKGNSKHEEIMNIGGNQTNRELCIGWTEESGQKHAIFSFLAVCTPHFLLVDVINGWPWARDGESNDNSLLFSLLFSIVFLRLSVQFEVSPLIMITLVHSQKDSLSPSSLSLL